MKTIIRVFNKNKYISTKQFNQCVKLLPDKYKHLNIDITVLSYKLEFLKYIWVENMLAKLYNVFTNKLNGTSCNHCNKIFICAFNFWIQDDFEYSKMQKLKVIETLYHEIQHQYQRQTINNFHVSKRVPYHDRWEEKDAKKFASKMMNNNYNKISKLFN